MTEPANAAVANHVRCACAHTHVCRGEWFISEPSPWQVPLLGLAQGPISSAAAANNPLAVKSYARRTTLTGGSGTGAAGVKAVAAVASLSAVRAGGGAAGKAPTSPKSPSKAVATAAAAGVRAELAHVCHAGTNVDGVHSCRQLLKVPVWIFPAIYG